jgi:hypothetical protein
MVSKFFLRRAAVRQAGDRAERFLDAHAGRGVRRIEGGVEFVELFVEVLLRERPRQIRLVELHHERKIVSPDFKPREQAL